MRQGRKQGCSPVQVRKALLSIGHDLILAVAAQVRCATRKGPCQGVSGQFLKVMIPLLVALASMDGAAADPPGGAVFTNDRNVAIPVRCDKPELVNRLQLYVSADQGKQWHLYASVPATQQEVTFVAPGDGVYWFDLVVHHSNGEIEPKAPGKRPPLLVLYVDTKPPRVNLRAVPANPGEAAIQWAIEDEYPDWRTFRLEYRDPQSASWTPLAVIPAVARGEKRWPVPGGGQVLVRLIVADLAENVGQAQLELTVQPASFQTPEGFATPMPNPPPQAPPSPVAHLPPSGISPSLSPPVPGAVNPTNRFQNPPTNQQPAHTFQPVPLLLTLRRYHYPPGLENQPRHRCLLHQPRQ
ncbi:MAG: hypothetical protein RMJ82_06040 [Gemmatales bacterium]|nr:hypothetical protein [Gemmatales bacterium]